MKSKKVFKYRGQNITLDFGNNAANKMLTQELVDRPEFQKVLNQHIGKIMDKQLRQEKLERLKTL